MLTYIISIWPPKPLKLSALIKITSANDGLAFVIVRCGALHRCTASTTNRRLSAAANDRMMLLSSPNRLCNLRHRSATRQVLLSHSLLDSIHLKLVPKEKNILNLSLLKE